MVRLIQYNMRNFLAFALCLLTVPLALAQGYKPHAGETALKMEIEGRGTVWIRLLTKQAPKTTEHIVRLAKNGFYDNQRFHRADRTPKPYLVQVGDPGSKNGNIDDLSIGSGGSGARIPYEDSGMPNVAGAVGLARIVEDKESGDSQFYILLGVSKFLDGRYTVFGNVVSGMDVVKRIERGDRIVSVSVVNG